MVKIFMGMGIQNLMGHMRMSTVWHMLDENSWNFRNVMCAVFYSLLCEQHGGVVVSSVTL